MTEALEHHLSEAAKIIQFMLPFLSEKAKESGDVAGIQLNAQQFLCSPIVVRARTKAAEKAAIVITDAVGNSQVTPENGNG